MKRFGLWWRGEWYWRVGRHLTVEALQRKVAWLLPRKIALWAFIRVYGCTGDGPGPDYERCYKAWEAGAGR